MSLLINMMARTFKRLVCVVVVVGLVSCCLAQNNNSSSKKPAKKGTKRTTKKPPNLDGLDFSDFSGVDFSGVDKLLREQKEWPYVASSSHSSVHYGTKTIRTVRRNILRVWTKTTLKDETAETKSEFLRDRSTQGLRAFGYENFSHTLELDEYNCTRDEGRVLVQLDYDKRGNVIHSMTYRNPEWTYIVPNSVGESLFRAVCKRRK